VVSYFLSLLSRSFVWGIAPFVRMMMFVNCICRLPFPNRVNARNASSSPPLSDVN
jgi:hypothetical protein